MNSKSLFYNELQSTYHNWIFGELSVKDCIESIKNGSCVIIVDDENRENEGDLIMASEDASPELIAQFLNLTSGVICCSITQEKANILKLDKMNSNSKDPNNTAFTTTIDTDIGITTGISAIDRAKTLKAIVYDNNPDNFRQPGHIFPLISKSNGVLERPGHTEAAIDICKLASKYTSGILAEIVSKDKITMAKLDELTNISNTYNYPLTSIQDIICYRIKYNK